MVQAKNATPRIPVEGETATKDKKKKRTKICVVGVDVDAKSYRPDQCRRGKHHHIHQSALDELIRREEIKPLDWEENPDPKQLKPEFVYEWLVPDKVLRRKMSAASRGMSSKFGEYLSRAAANGQRWAGVMISEIRESESGKQISRYGGEGEESTRA